MLGFGIGSLNSTLRFDGTEDVSLELNTASLSGSWQVNNKWSLRGGLGLILGGNITDSNNFVQNVQPGGVVSVGCEYQAIIGEGYTPSIDYSLFLSGSATEIENPNNKSRTSYVSSDLRLGARASWNIKERLFPFASARLFGGPVRWTLHGKDVTGTDIHHYQLAVGAAMQFGDVGTYFEFAGMGEKAMSLGVSYAWQHKS
ncbi:hypothetical protein KQI63_01035 [bacterium]|nr:hypothetical protein [bacterium]